MVKPASNNILKFAILNTECYGTSGKGKTPQQREETLKAKAFAKKFLAKTDNVIAEGKNYLKGRVNIGKPSHITTQSQKITTNTHAKPIVVR